MKSRCTLVVMLALGVAWGQVLHAEEIPLWTWTAPPTWAAAGASDAATDSASVSFTVTNTLGAGFLLVYPAGGAVASVSTLNHLAVQTVANAAVVPLGTGGALTAVPGVYGFDLLIDVNGYYAPSTGGSRTVLVGASQLAGGPVTGSGTVRCVGVYDANYNSPGYTACP